MAQIKPAEVSAILRQELAGFKDEVQLEEVGTVLQVGDGIARVYGLTNAQAGELVEHFQWMKQKDSFLQRLSSNPERMAMLNQMYAAIMNVWVKVLLNPVNQPSVVLISPFKGTLERF